MALMKTQTSVGPTKVAGGLRGSKCRVLTGNALHPTPSYKTSIGTRLLRSIYNNFNQNVITIESYYPAFTSSPLVSLYDYLMADDVGYTQMDISVDLSPVAGYYTPAISPSSWGSISTCDNINVYYSGTAMQSWDYTTHTGTPYSQPHWATLGDTYFGMGNQTAYPWLLDTIPISVNVEPNAPNPPIITCNGLIKMSNPADFSGDYTTLVTDVFAKTWNWNLGRFDLSYSQAPLTYAGANVDLTGYNPSLYTGAMGVTTQSIATTNIISNDNFKCRNGWHINVAHAIGTMTVWRGIAKNNNPFPTPYMIGRYRDGIVNYGGSGSFNDPYGFYSCIASGSYTYKIIDFVSGGMIGSGSTIGQGVGNEVQLPFPAVGPYPRQDLGNNPLAQDFYFALIGEDIGQIGTFTGTTR